MYIAESLVRDRHREHLKQAQQERSARHVAELRKLDRIRQRAERDLLRAWERTDELNGLLESVSHDLDPVS